ncbi:phosphorylase [Salinisphaera sp. USBA-960]|uniref:ATP adenylyltransferase family protein n=1 Tax=Salinisphaera orenii TaxID=856731 RepID=UPI000DBE6AAC|nr:phosphorylase [Salifodinibacter halophilus]NNC25612.1 phosphorylase [Salifodinibacter halophilus]
MNWHQATTETTEHAHAAGALAPIATRVDCIREGGIAFAVRQIEARPNKPGAGDKKSIDPFAPPYEPTLYVGDISRSHVGLLNKFPVLDDHLLIVSRAFRPQTAALDMADCEALLAVVSDWDGLAFYNGGLEAGASQPHRHLQMVGLPLSPAGDRLPVANALAQTTFQDEIGQSPALPFPHAATRMPPDALADPVTGARAVYRRYIKLLAAIGRPAGDSVDPGPYNLLATRDWLWAVPRTRAAFNNIEINGLGFAGALIAGDQDQHDTLHAYGPMRCLRAVCDATATPAD